ncbi:IS66-like element accessory protein TnpA [Methylobacterium durans]|nr:transposase [Methylobacterium durans]
MLDHMLEPRTVRRLELFTGVTGRRRWSDEAKDRILQEALRPGAVVSEVARRHGLSPQHLFTWRRLARQARRAAAPSPLFVPAVVEPIPQEPRMAVPPHEPACRSLPRHGIEVEIGGAVVRIGAGAQPDAITAVIRALKAGS